jgi:hypothetical protein
MRQLLRFWLDLCLLRVPPQHLPASPWLLGFSLGCYLLLSVLASTISSGFVTGMQIALLDTVMLSVFAVALLYLLSKPQRILQTLSALAGAGTMLGIPAVALSLVVVSGIGPGAESMSWLWLLLLFWNLLVTAHIIRHAMSSSLALGVAVSLLYILVSTQVMVTSFPQLAGQ